MQYFKTSYFSSSDIMAEFTKHSYDQFSSGAFKASFWDPLRQHCKQFLCLLAYENIKKNKQYRILYVRILRLIFLNFASVLMNPVTFDQLNDGVQ